jgi:hypothetical protein
MWHATQRLPAEPGSWRVCAGASCFDGWQARHWASSKREASGLDRTSRYPGPCGSWQSTHVIAPLR